MTILDSLHRGASRREFLRLAALGALGASSSGWLPQLAAAAAGDPKRRRSCVLLWMNGGPSQTDTFDMKPDHENGGEFKPIATSVPGIQICEHLPQLAKHMRHFVPIRSMHTKEGDHGRAAFLMRTGYRPRGRLQFPTMGSLLSKELAREGAELPDYVSIGPYQALNPAAYSPGFLGPRRAPLVVGGAGGGAYRDGQLGVRNLAPPDGVDRARFDARLGLLGEMEDDFAQTRPGAISASHQTAYEQAVRMMRSPAIRAFELDEEPAKLRDAYGRNRFGQGCLLARRLIERGVPFVEVALNGAPGTNGVFGWDTHQGNFPAVRALCEALDAGWAALATDLADRGLLEDTLIVWMGEFGRTPVINTTAGRDHFAEAWSVVLGGGGIKGGQVVGQTGKDGMKVEDRPVAAADLMATICRALGIDPWKQNMSGIGRPIRIADPEAQPIEEILA